MIGIIGAMKIEVDGLIEAMDKKKEEKINSFTFCSGLIEGKKAVVVRCGIGKVNAAAATAVMINSFSGISLILNMGVAGGIAPGIKQGDIVIGSAFVQHDYSQEPDGLKRGQIAELNTVEFPADLRAVEIMKQALKTAMVKIHTGVIATGDQFINDAKKADALFKEFNALAVDMESAAVAHVCYLMDKKFLSMRAVSDGAGNNAVSDFYEFVERASKISIAAVESFISAY